VNRDESVTLYNASIFGLPSMLYSAWMHPSKSAPVRKIPNNQRGGIGLIHVMQGQPAAQPRRIMLIAMAASSMEMILEIARMPVGPILRPSHSL